jgi:hypothetical protein
MAEETRSIWRILASETMSYGHEDRMKRLCRSAAKARPEE